MHWSVTLLKNRRRRGVAGSLALAAVALFACAEAPDTDTDRPIRLVGSSTVYPFATKVAEDFSNRTGHPVIIESTGSGGGHKLFCAGVGRGAPEIVNSSRPQKASEFIRCAENGVTEIIEIAIGFDGIVLATSRNAVEMALTPEWVFLALAANIPVGENCAFAPNPHQRWSDIDPSLPGDRIEVFGPPPTSGTRDAFVEILMELGAAASPCLAALKALDPAAFKAAAHTLREDGRWIDAGESDNSIVKLLENTPKAVGIFGHSFLERNQDRIRGLSIDGVAPTAGAIASGDYVVSRRLYVYVKAQVAAERPALQDLALEFTSEIAAGPGGYLEDIGLVPLTVAERARYRRAVKDLTPYRAPAPERPT